MTFASPKMPAAYKLRILLLAVLAAILASSCGASNRQQLATAVTTASEHNRRAETVITQLSSDLSSWSKAKTSATASKYIGRAVTDADLALSSERKGSAELAKLRSLQLGTAEREWVNTAEKAYKLHIAALTIVRDRLLVMSDIYAAMDGIDAANRSVDAATNNDIYDDKPAIRSAHARLKAARDALARSGKVIASNELKRAITLHQQLNVQLESAVVAGEWEKMSGIATGSAAGRTALISDRAISLTAIKIEKLMTGVATSRNLFAESQQLFLDANRQSAAFQR